jgi:hypothetical protein
VNAYIKFKPYNKDFYTEAFAKGVKGDGTVDFESALRLNGGKLQGGKLTKTLEDGKAVYLYGGRKALVREFTAFKNNVGDFVLKPPDTCWLTVYHGKVTVDMNKTKRILMILSYKKSSRVPLDISDRRLKVDLFEYQTAATGKANWGFYNHLDLSGLDRLVRAIPD